MTKSRKPGLAAADVDRFMKLQAQMRELLLRMTAISSKTPDLAVNKFKVGMLNEQLRIANGILVDGAKPFESFEIFDDVSLPTNSDMIIVLSQYLACLESWRSDHVVYDEDQGEWCWNAAGNEIIQTRPPSNRGGE